MNAVNAYPIRAPMMLMTELLRKGHAGRLTSINAPTTPGVSLSQSS